MKVHLLGVNGPFPESGGATSGYLLEAGETLIQFDFGCGVLARLTAKTAPESLRALFLSHWHFDHTSDLGVLMYRLEACGAKLPVYAPVDESSAMRRMVQSAACFELTDVAAGDVISIDGVSVSVTASRHPVPAVGFVVNDGEKTFGYTGDTNTLPTLARDYQGCDLLLADGLFPQEAWAEGKPHLSAELAAKLAAEASCGRLVITHLNPLIPPHTLLDEARACHPNVTLATAGSILTV